jgi:hypothetical protein
MILTQIEIEPQTGGLAIPVIQRVFLITILMQKVSLEPLILTGIYLERQSLTSCLTLRIRFDSLQSLTQASVLRTSFSQAKLHRLAWGGVSESILELTRMTIIAISLSLSRAMQMARSLISQ